ncbi:MAG TPA: LytTR family DNA-binding domain-containing protein [Rhodothermales bacterium]|nr:LytTR family DNA-binding domain-containing protein [Rhodothermales bacterium]
MRCLIVDDDELSRTLIQNFIAHQEGLELAGSCGSAVEAANLLERRPVDLIFLDIEMPVMSGMDFVTALPDRPQIIFVTAKQEYALQAFDVEVTDYLLKPVSYGRFLKAVHRAQRQFILASAQHADSSHVFIKTDGRLTKLDLGSVRWIEAQGDYAIIRTSQRNLTVHTTMKALEDKLPPALFARVHRSYIVRLDQIDGIEDASIIMDRDVIPIGSSYRDALLQRLYTI